MDDTVPCEYLGLLTGIVGSPGLWFGGEFYHLSRSALTGRSLKTPYDQPHFGLDADFLNLPSKLCNIDRVKCA